MQYLLQPIGMPTSDRFYLDVSHMKSGTDSDDATRRNDEAVTLTQNAQSLGSSAHIVSLGDFNITNGSSEQTYQTMIGQFHDIGDPGESWTDTSSTAAKAIMPLLSESATDVEYRDDIQFVSAAAEAGSGSAGLQYDTGSYTVFGNGGSTSLYEQNVTNYPTDNPGVFPDLTASQRSTILEALQGASDHLPVVADYNIVSVPEPGSFAILLISANLLMTRKTQRLARRQKSPR